MEKQTKSTPEKAGSHQTNSPRSGEWWPEGFLTKNHHKNTGKLRTIPVPRAFPWNQMN